MKLNYIKYPSIEYIRSGESLEGSMYEKIDGSNVQVSVSGNQVIPGTRSKPLSNYKRFLSWMNDFQKDVYTNQTFRQIDPNVIVFLEYLSNHSIVYDRFSTNMILIDVYNRQTEKFMEYELAKQLIAQMGIQGVESLEKMDEGHFSFEDLEKLCKRIYAERDDFEGLLIKNYEKNVFKKIVVEQIDEIFDDIISEIPKKKLKGKEEVKELIDHINKTKNRMMHYDIITDKLRDRKML